jgi:hypothetical protein
MTTEQPIYKLSRHAEVRCAQRSYRHDDISVVLQYGTSTVDGILMRQKDVREAAQDLHVRQKNPNLKRQLKMLQGLVETLIITAGNTIITIQRADVDKQHRQSAKACWP